MITKSIFRKGFTKSFASSALLKPSPMKFFGAMGEINQDMFEHKFTDDLDFRSGFDKMKCFRVMDEEGNIINKKYENSIDDETLKKMFKTMVMMNEADVVFSAA